MQVARSIFRGVDIGHCIFAATPDFARNYTQKADFHAEYCKMNSYYLRNVVTNFKSLIVAIVAFDTVI